MKFTKKSIEFLRRYAGPKGYLETKDLEGVPSDGKLTPEGYSVYIANEAFFIDSANMNLSPLSVETYDDLMEIYACTGLEASEEVKKLEEELKGRREDEKRLIPASIVINKGVLDVL